MSNSKDKLDRETTNCVRVLLMLTYPCTNILCKILHKEISPDDLEEKTKLTRHMSKNSPKLNEQQLSCIRDKNYSKFDITLLYNVLRNFCSIPEHKNKWGKTPDPKDRTVSANIERIRLIRNECIHSMGRAITDEQFEKKWKTIFDIVRELERYVGTSTESQDDVTRLRTCQLDPGQSVQEFIDEILMKLRNIEDDVQAIQKSINRPRMNDFHKEDMEKWRKEDKVYAETHSFHAMYEQVRQNTFTTFIGSSGSGKTATARHIALKLHAEEGYEIVPIRNIKDFESLYYSSSRQVFVFDDVFGVFGLQMEKYYLFKDYEDRLDNLKDKQTKVLMTCREVVYKTTAFARSCLSKQQHLIHLLGTDLSDQDKRKIMTAHNLNTAILTEKQLSQVSEMFPLLCQLFSNQNFNKWGAQFFLKPIPPILKELDDMQVQNSVHYALLVLMMFNENKLSEEDLCNGHSDGHFDKVKSIVLEKCDISNRNLTNALKEMEESYTKKHGDEFVFIHDAMLEITAHHFGSRYPDLILLYMNSDYIANHIKVKTSNDTEGKIAMETDAKVEVNESENSLYITLQKRHYKLLAERLYKDVEKGELYNVFGNEALKHPHVLNCFIELMKGLPYIDLYSLFLSEMNDNIKIRTKNDRGQKNKKKYETYDSVSEVEDHGILINEKYSRISVRAISWVIYYGHHRILQYLIDQIMKHKESIDDLFRNIYNKTSGIPSLSETGEFELENDSENSLMMIQFSFNEISFAYREPVIHEHYRLFCLSCYSGDFNTVKILMKHVDKNVIRVGKNKTIESYWGIYPFGIACFFGFEDITMELLKVGIDINNKNVLFQPLLDACASGHDCVVNKLIEAGANVNAANYEHSTPLIVACKKGEIRTVTVLIQKGADVNQASYTEYYKRPEGMDAEEWNKMKLDENSVGFHREEYETPITAACKNDHVDVAELLIKAGADVNVKKQNYGTPLTLACKNGHLKIVELLLREKAKINLGDSTGKTPIVIALRNGHFDIVDMLINKECYFNPQNCSEISLMRACYEGQLSAVKNLLKAGVDVNVKYGIIYPVTVACIKGHHDIVDELVKSGTDVNLKDGDHTLLSTACLRGHLKVVNVLLKAKADANLSDEYQTPLIAACTKEHVSIVNELIEFGADVNLGFNSRTPMITACSTTNLSIVDMLIKAGADVNATIEDNFFGTSLIAACWNNSFPIVDKLIKEKADVNLRSSHLTPLYVACKEADLDIVKRLIEERAQIGQNALLNACKPAIIRTDRRKELSNIMKALIEAGADVNGSEEDDAPLTIACSYGFLDVVNVLLEAGANVNVKRKCRTPLTTACFNGHLEIVKQLIEFGSDADQVDVCKTPLTAACFNGFVGVVEYLIKKGANVNLGDGYRTPLLSANVGNSLKIVKTLIQAHADVNFEYKGNTPLLAACRGRDFLVVKELIEAGADVNFKVQKISPLIMAYWGDDKYVIEELIEAGANF